MVKLRPVVPSELPPALRKLPDFGVEVDALPGGYVCSASFKAKLGQTDVRAAALGQRPLRKLFTKGQRAFFAEHAPEGIELDDLSILGPMNVLKLKFSPTGLRPAPRRRAVAVPRRLADPRALHQVPARRRPSRSPPRRRPSSAIGASISAGEQQTKTATALKFFSDELQRT